ncbi:DNA topoisomerase I [Fusobacterium animalis]|uniref:DNA topoisomerase n=2 Tax=Fusobacterium animalis TaxID=76859 RepID=A0A2G9FI06_9FUSO|nr:MULTISPECIES: DNA topoisomerase [Fusobacterium]ERT37105.1 DNA topoisomerase III [Fusobacterium nucleatum CTI-5]PIM92334.1 DNA topoisomerase I [Fusobacterium animalis]PIM94588.1 DNA topoisomerase I [Fusobacterium animalis]
MSKRLIIAEKPSLGRAIANALNVKKFTGEKSNGYYENENYIITWCFGHLFKLKDIGDYDGLDNISWEDIYLPFLPNPFELKYNPGRNEEEGEGIKKQIEIIKELVAKDDINEIVHCGDADREGQVIVNEILEYIGNNKKVTRLWLPEQTEDTIQKQIMNCKENSTYEDLYNEGLTRIYMDWFLGINLTIFLSVKAKTKLNVGRVIIPIIKYIYDREQAIKNFKVEKYFQLESKTEKENIKIPLILRKERFNSKEEAEKVANELNNNKAKVISIEKKEIKKYPGKLFSLGKVQSELSKNHKMNFDHSLKIIQKLYEEGYITYPRTNTEYLAEEEKDRIKNLIDLINQKGYKLEFKDSKKIFDTSKIESHSALTPTLKLPEKLSKEEEIVYQVIFNRFVSNFLAEEAILSETTLTIKVDNKEFKLKGTEIITPGFYTYEPKKFDNQLPNLSENEEFEVKFLAVEKETEPPKKVTESELGNYLEHPFRKELKEKNTEDEENDEEIIEDAEDYKSILEGIEIGTVATRTGIISNAKTYGYITQENSNYSITSKGEKLIQLLDELKINLYKERTIEFSKDLKKVFHNMKTIDDVLGNTWNVLNEIIENGKDIKPSVEFIESLGKCPKCGGKVFERAKTYSCENEDFILWKESKHYKEKFSINQEEAKKFLANETVQCTLISEDKKSRKANLKIKLNGEYVNFEEERESVGKCPICGKEVVESEKMFYCTGNKDGCVFKLWKEAKHFSNTLKITKSIAKKLLKKNGSSKFEVSGKDGNKKEVNLKIKINGNYVNFEEVKEIK